VEFREIVTNGVRLHCALDGPEDGDLVVCLHGFPEFYKGMLGPMRALAEAGFRVVAPDQRGYNLSEKPRGVDAYTADETSADVVGLIEALGYERADIVGHDWGAAVTWWTAIRHPERVRRIVVANVPHPSVMAKEIRTNRAQMRKSWYIFAFQTPWLPDALGSSALARRRFAETIAKTANPGSITPEYQAELQRAWSQPGAVTGMINWYRAAVQRRPGRVEDKRVHVPTMILWGEQDVALGASMVQPSADLCDDVVVHRFPNATHWILHDEPEATARLIVDFLSA
jgi:pimeloyl-ACP methyl ester carboxylesterase